MTRARLLDLLAKLFFWSVFGGYVIYLAHLYATTGGHW